MANKFPYKDTVIPPSRAHLELDIELCASCMQCVHSCALKNYGVGSHELTNVRMLSYSKYEWDSYAVFCVQCDDPKCMRACPVGAIQVDENTGARVVNKDLCIGCKLCIKACPYEPKRIIFDDRNKTAGKCTLCGGDPACVKACPTGALKYVKTKNQEDSYE